jgi:cobalt-zinc-cadmium efflux system membrane fusion protein
MYKRFLVVLMIAAFALAGCQKGKVEEAHKDDHEREEHHEEIVLTPETIKQAGIEIGEVSLRPLKIESSFPGKVSVNETKLAHVGPRIAGRAVEVYANLGEFVKKGQPLAVIDSPELGEAQSQYLKAKTNLQVAEKSYERAKVVLEGKAISAGEFQRREGEYLSSRAEAKAAEDRLHLLGMTENELSAIGKGHTISSKVAIYAPVSGTVIERHLTLGEVVEPVKPLFVIADLSNLWVIADIPENDVSKIGKGQMVSVIASSYPDKEFTGSVTYISDTVDPATRSVKIRAEVTNPPSPPFVKGGQGGILKPEMFSTVKIGTGRMEALAVPESAVQREGDKTVVFVAESENTFQKRVVTLGPEVDGYHQVLSGLESGERIVTKGAFILKSEGMKGEMEEHGH